MTTTDQENQMRYMLFVATDPEAEPYDAEHDTIQQWVGEVYGSGIGVLGDRLREPQDARTVRVRDGELLVTDGPFTESKEWIAGFDIIECADLDEAVAIAGRHPMARFGRIEVREFWTLGLGSES
ncbi:YciI family protein [Leifsonia sp. Leaf264]|uniref:YciI family protein n=1 Tax=Leifsonia sp. Leaf264 TaxID=1736314 RepID=UPI000B18E40D